MGNFTSKEDTIIVEGYRNLLNIKEIAEQCRRSSGTMRSTDSITAHVMRLRQSGAFPAQRLPPGSRPKRSDNIIGTKHVVESAEPDEVASTGEGWELRGNEHDRVLLLRSATIRDPYAALKEANVNQDDWEIKDFVVNKWDVAAKRKDGVSMMVTELWQVKVWLRRKDTSPIKSAIESLLAQIHKYAPKYPRIKTKINAKHMLEISLFDTHFGKLAWGMETGDDYDLKIAERIYHDAVVDLLAKTHSFGVEKILFPVGQDFFHIDNDKNTTFNGTLQDVDGRLPKIFDVGCRSIIRAIDYCAAVAPVEVLWIPGNHDRETSMYLCKLLKAWYRNCDRVQVDDGPKFRKYYRYGVCLIGFTHGDMEKHASLPAIMAGEVPHDWAESQHREWHLGHFHKKKEVSYSAGDTHVGVQVRVLPSLCGTDAWHYDMGYVKNRRSAEAYLWNRETGYAGHLASNTLESPDPLAGTVDPFEAATKR